MAFFSVTRRNSPGSPDLSGLVQPTAEIKVAPLAEAIRYLEPVRGETNIGKLPEDERQG